MNYGQIISQAWQIVKRTKLLWLFGLMYFLSFFLNYRNMQNLALYCISLIIAGLSILLMGFSPIGMILCADKVIQGEAPLFTKIWHEFKSFFWRWILLELALIIPSGILLICALISLVPINALLNNAINNLPSRIFFASIIAGPFVSGIRNFSFNGLLVHKLGVLKSIRHGLSVFNMNWGKSVVLSLFFTFPIIISYLIFWFIQLSTGAHPTITTLIQSSTSYPAKLWLSFLSSFTHLFELVSFLLAYYQFIKIYDYPTLRQITPKT